MTLTRTILAASLVLASTGYALAQQPATLDDLDAERVSPTQVEIEFEYDGSACETVGTAQPGTVTDGVLAVSFPTTATAEVCTQQIVEIEVEQTVAAPEGVTAVAVTVLRPDGTVLATDTEEVDHD